MSHRPNFTPRELQERAIAAMRKSIDEPRDDGDQPPKVGAVLWKPDGTIETAFRGEMRYGDHAEYTLLDRKNYGNPLDGSVVFATLEPCAPKARKPPKVACAERIVNARIKEVWVGIQDPHPKVAGKGSAFLRENGVRLRAFDRDLQEIIRNENDEFIAQAELKAKQERSRKNIRLSEYERASPSAALDDLSQLALDKYRSFLQVEGQHGDAEFHKRLQHQGLLEPIESRLVPTGFGMLLFGKHPRDSAPQAGLLGTIHYPDGTEEIRDFDGPMVTVPDEAIQWLKDKTPNPIDRSGAQRKEANERLFQLAREGIVNALVHRDYSIRGAKCQLVVGPDTIVIRSPGKPVEPITLEQLQSLDAPMVSRNPVPHVVFGRMELAEERGLGLKSMRLWATDVGLPLPSYRWEDPYLVLTLFRSSDAAVRGLSAEVQQLLNDDERAAWQFIAGLSSVTTPQLMKRLGFGERKAQRVLKKLLDLELVQRVGKGPATHYEVIGL